MANKHAVLSASSSERWLNCPPSARLCENYEDKGSDYAAEGTDAHTLCAAVDNTFTGAVRRTTGGFLSTKHAGLGLGTASVRSIAEKYHGVCRLEPRDGMFCASVLLELPQEKL